MTTTVSEEPRIVRHAAAADAATYSIIMALSFSHFLNDMIQSLLPSLYPMIKNSYGLSFAQIGMITLTQQLVSSVLQPIVGAIADRRPRPYSLAIGMGATLIGLLTLAHATSFGLLLLAAAMVGSGSAVFHPEASRVARLASGGRHGLAQSLFQVGGNVGSATGPILAAFIVIPRGQGSISWFSAAALIAMAVLIAVGNWHWRTRTAPARGRAHNNAARSEVSSRRVAWAIVILLMLLFSKSFYQSSLNSYYTFYLIHKFGVSVERAQIYLFIFLASVAVGTLAGGPIGDRIGRKWVIWGSILGVIPFTLALPYAGLAWTPILTIVIGMTMASASSAIVVYAIDLIPGKVGTVAGLFFGLSFGLGGIGAAALGRLADFTSIDFVYQVCAYLPLLGLMTIFLPDVGRTPKPPRGLQTATPVPATA